MDRVPSIAHGSASLVGILVARSLGLAAGIAVAMLIAAFLCA